MAYRQFDNPNQLSLRIILFRLLPIDPEAEARIENGIVIDPVIPLSIKKYNYVSVQSEVLTDAQITKELEKPITDAEKSILKRMADADAQAVKSLTFYKLTPEQGEKYIETNVKTLEDTKVVMKEMMVILLAMRDKIWPELPEK